MKIFPELSVRLERGSNDEITFELHTFSPDADDDGHGRDYGVSLIEGGTYVGDDDDQHIRQLASLIEHAPDLMMLLGQFLNGNPNALQRRHAQRVLKAIEAGELVYGDRL